MITTIIVLITNNNKNFTDSDDLPLLCVLFKYQMPVIIRSNQKLVIILSIIRKKIIIRSSHLKSNAITFQGIEFIFAVK